MGVYSGPEITNDGLVLALDAANLKGYDKYENLITHSSMSGWTVGVLGSGGSLPTGWVLDQLQPGSAITIIGGGTENGLNYVDIRFSATSVTTSNRTLIRPGNSVTTDGSTYYLTSYSKLVSGSSTNLTHINFHTGALSLTSTLTRNVGASAVLSGTFFPRYDIGYNGTGVAYDITIRFAAPQLEKGSSATDYYATTGTAKTRGTTLIDMSGRGNNGTLTNGPTYSSANGGSIVFDGTNDWVSCSSNPSYNVGTGDFSVFCWMKSNNKSNYQTIMTLDDAASGNGILFYTNAGDGVLRTWIGGSVRNGSIDICNNVWNFVGTTRISGTVTHYINSISNGTYIASGSVIANQNLRLGSYDGSGYMFNGNISNTTIYNRALTAAEIQQNFNATKSRYGL